MALFILKKKKVIFVIGIISIAIISLLAPYKGGPGGSYSVLGCIMNLELVEPGAISSAFSMGTASLWFYILAPLIVAVPVLSYISEVEGSEFNKMEKMRTGRIKYNAKRVGWMIAGSACMLFLGILLYMAVILPFFELSDAYYFQDEVKDESTLKLIYGLAVIFIKKFVYMLGYSSAVSVFAACVLYIYNDMFFVMSIVFAMLYVLRDWIFAGNVLQVIILAIIFAVTFILLGKWGDRT